MRVQVQSTTTTVEDVAVNTPSGPLRELARPSDVGAESRIASDVEAWLRTSVAPGAPVLWCPRGVADDAVGSADDLAGRVAGLRRKGAWAVARRAHGRTWAQTMRVRGGWIVEVNGIPGPECFARRVQTSAGSRGRGRSRSLRSGGRTMAVYGPQDVIRTARDVGGIMWAWQRGVLLDGYALGEIAQ